MLLYSFYERLKRLAIPDWIMAWYLKALGIFDDITLLNGHVSEPSDILKPLFTLGLDYVET
jgi:hypothetical protein